MKPLDPPAKIELPATASLAKSDHVFDSESVAAINAALAAGRPLLVRGEPGTGKSQLARAAAIGLGRVFLSKVVDSRTEARDLLYTFDAVARLAEAQVVGALKLAPDEVRHQLRPSKYVEPGPLWWAFDWQSAADQAAESGAQLPDAPAGWSPAAGAVLLIDEIDKADSALPNGLLEALGSSRFPKLGNGYVTCRGASPLTVVTTNEERSLPDAFLRRCLVLQLGWPRDAEALIAALLAWGRAHFPQVEAEVLSSAAKLVARARAEVRGGLNPPGGAEYLDLVQAVVGQGAKGVAGQMALLEKIHPFVLRKHPQERET